MRAGIVCFLAAVCCFFAVFAEQTESPDLKVGIEVAQFWLKGVDQGNYQSSWNQTSRILQQTMPQGEWARYLEAIRKPLGSVSKRVFVEAKEAKDPQELPPGDYMFVYYQTNFGGREGRELVTLAKDSSGKWKVLTYQVR